MGTVLSWKLLLKNEYMRPKYMVNCLSFFWNCMACKCCCPAEKKLFINWYPPSKLTSPNTCWKVNIDDWNLKKNSVSTQLCLHFKFNIEVNLNHLDIYIVKRKKMEWCWYISYFFTLSLSFCSSKGTSHTSFRVQWRNQWYWPVLV